MGRRPKLLVSAGLTAAVLVAGGGIAVGAGITTDDDDDRPITGPALERAVAAALAHVGGGRVSGTEVGDEEGYYEVEVTLPDGSQVDVHLDEHFGVLSQDADRDHAEDDAEDDGDRD